MNLGEKGVKELVKKVYELSNKTCFFSLIIPIIGLVSNVFSLFGKSFSDIFSKVSFMYTEEGTLTTGTRIALIVFIIISVFFTLVKHIGDKWNLASDKIAKELFDTLLNMEIGLRKNSYDKEKEVINQKKYEKLFSNPTGGTLNKSPYTERTSRLNSVYRIEQIIQRSTVFLANLFGFNENYVNMTLIYKKDENSSWEILCKKNLRDDELDIGKLINNEDSMFNQVLSSPEKYEFYLSKEDAFNEGKYVKNSREKANGMSGSIYCKNLSIYDSNGTLKKGFVLAIGTKKYAFCDNDIFQKNLCKKAFRVIEDNIKRETMDLYIIEYLGLGGI